MRLLAGHTCGWPRVSQKGANVSGTTATKADELTATEADATEAAETATTSTGDDQGVSAQDTDTAPLGAPLDTASGAPDIDMPPVEQGDRPSAGRIVHYVLDTGDGIGQCRAAIVTREPWGDGNTPMLNLSVFTDGANDGLNDGRSQISGALAVWRSSVHYNADRVLGSWHWFGTQRGSTHA